MSNHELFDLLRSVDTPTVCNAIEVAQGKRGFANFTRETVIPIDAHLPAFFGYARTATLRGLAPPEEDAAIIKQRRMDYYRYVAEAPAPSVMVVEDLDGKDAVAAYWGEINTCIHQSFGIAGVLTNGVIRDLGDVAADFQVLAGKVGPSHGFVHIVDIDVPVTVFGLTVRPQDFIHADRHGAVVVPEDILPKLPEAIGKLLASERIILDAAAQTNFDFAAFEKAWQDFEKARV